MNILYTNLDGEILSILNSLPREALIFNPAEYTIEELLKAVKGE